MIPATPTHRTSPSSGVHWGWAVLAAACLGLAATLGLLTSNECSGGQCTTIVAGGPIGWVALAPLLALAMHAIHRALGWRVPRGRTFRTQIIRPGA